MGTAGMVLKRPLPCSSRVVPGGAPLGFSGVFSRIGASVRSAHCCSEVEGWRPSTTSLIAESAMADSGAEGRALLSELLGAISANYSPLIIRDARIGSKEADFGGRSLTFADSLLRCRSFADGLGGGMGSDQQLAGVEEREAFAL